MLELISNLPAHVVGVRAIGDVHKDDLENVLLPALEEQVAKFDAIYYLLLLETDVKNWDLGAWLSDVKAGIKHLTKWTKIAVVTDQEGVQKFTDLFSKVTPGEARGYPLSELEIATKWLSEKV